MNKNLPDATFPTDLNLYQIYVRGQLYQTNKIILQNCNHTLSPPGSHKCHQQYTYLNCTDLHLRPRDHSAIVIVCHVTSGVHTACSWPSYDQCGLKSDMIIGQLWDFPV